MPDICMCEGLDCPKKKNCYRFIVEPLPINQTYFKDPPYCFNIDFDEVPANPVFKCEYYWRIKNDSNEND